jgi:hypothetical protein
MTHFKIFNGYFTKKILREICKADAWRIDQDAVFAKMITIFSSKFELQCVLDPVNYLIDFSTA